MRGTRRGACSGALAAARMVSTFRQTLSCEPQVEFSAPASMLPRRREGAGRWPGGSWVFNPDRRTITSGEGTLIATLSPALERADAGRAGQLLAAAPEMSEAMAAAQQLGVALLSGRPPMAVLAPDMRQALGQLDQLTTRLGLACHIGCLQSTVRSGPCAHTHKKFDSALQTKAAIVPSNAATT